MVRDIDGVKEIICFFINRLFTHRTYQLNNGYVVKVSELMRASLPKPRKKQNVLKGADGETLPLITVRCEDDF